MSVKVLVCLGAMALLACDDDVASRPSAPGDTPEVGKGDRADAIPADWSARVDALWLHLDLSEMKGQATIWFEPGDAERVSLEAAGLRIDAVYTDDDEGGTRPLKWEKRDGALHVVHDVDDGPLHVDYGFGFVEGSQGYSEKGSTVLWPYFCGNVFPCRSAPDDGMTFELSVSGHDEALSAIYPGEVYAEGPSYMLAFALGRYECQMLGRTTAGTTVDVCWLPRGKTAALGGTRPLVAAFDWLEQHLGRYPFGDRVASVAVDWGKSGAGGMEHHPFWHVAKSEMGEPVTHVHEAVHGWFGNGVRMACWEDFVLSEGTTTYLTARALGAVTDKATERAIWESYRAELLYALEDEDIVAWPETCGAVDLLSDGLFSNIVYMKGAFFWKAVAEAIGAERLDRVFARFFTARVGTAASMGELLDAVRDETGFDPEPLADKWLRSPGNPF